MMWRGIVRLGIRSRRSRMACPTTTMLATMALLLLGMEMRLCDAWRHDNYGGPMGTTSTTTRRTMTHLSQITTKKSQYASTSWWGIPRGGIIASETTTATATTTTTTPAKQKKKKKKRTSSSKKEPHITEPGTRVVKEAIQQDPAEALGDAIRDRAHVLRADDPTLEFPPHAFTSSSSSSSSSGDRPQHHGTNNVPASVTSLGLALGSSDVLVSHTNHHGQEGGGVQVSATAVVANYFLQSHGGAHGLQSVASLAAVLFGMCALLCGGPSTTTTTTIESTTLILTCMRRCWMAALTKHVTGLLAAALLSAKRIPLVGLAQTRQSLEALVWDPVAQYIFYCALLLVWLPPASYYMSTSSSSPPWWLGGGSSSSAKDAAVRWWHMYNVGRKQRAFLAKLVLLGPVLLREIVSTAWVVSDVWVLWVTSSSPNNHSHGSTNNNNTSMLVWKGLEQAWNNIMSLLVTPERWKGSTSGSTTGSSPMERQRMLAKGVSRLSLACEVAVGGLLCVDAVRVMISFAFLTDQIAGHDGRRPPLTQVVRRVTCARLFLYFLWSIRRNRLQTAWNHHMIQRGGGGGSTTTNATSSVTPTATAMMTAVLLVFGHDIPNRVLDILLNPSASMGLVSTTEHDTLQENNENDTWWTTLAIATGFKE